MSNGLKKDTVVILRMEGEDLLDFMKSPDFETVMIPPLWKIDGSFHHCVVMAIMNLTVDHGMPPVSNVWVNRNILKPALDLNNMRNEKDFSRETILEETKKVVKKIANILKEHPVIVSHNECIFDGSEIRKLFSNKIEFDKTIDELMENLKSDDTSKISKVRFVIDVIIASAGLSPFCIKEMENLIEGVLKNLDDDKDEDENDGKKNKEMIIKVMNSITMELEKKPISVITDSIVEESISSDSSYYYASIAAPTKK